MALIDWATHMLQWQSQNVTRVEAGVNRLKIVLVQIVDCNSST